MGKEKRMQWTTQQARAIELRNKNILVAAAAGSGKTAVLVERIKRLILEERCSVDQMLIVTFTNAAAAEMKEKIERAILKEINEIASSEESQAQKDDLLFLKKQLDLLPMVNISTFHAFALEVIGRYFYLTDIEPNFKICDNVQQTILKNQAMDQLMEELYEENEPEFYDFLSSYSGDRNDRRFREMVGKTYETIQSLPDPFPWLEHALEELACSPETFQESQVVAYIWQDAKQRLETACDKLQETVFLARRNLLTALEELAEKDLETGRHLLEIAVAENFDQMRDALKSFKLPSLTKKYFKPEGSLDELAMEEIKVETDRNRKPLKEAVSDFKKLYFYQSLEEHCANLNEVYPKAKYFAGVLRKYKDIYDMRKREKNLVDFNDIEHYAYEILKDEQAASYYRNKFHHIFIDEYQDSNVIQEALIDRIRRENNLFMVGDVKQSIYKFRLAEPEIFQEKYKKFAVEMEEKGEASLSEKIDLNRNFRSKQSVIDFINDIFSKMMGGYDENAALYLGDPHGKECNQVPKLFLAKTPWDEDDEIDDELKILAKIEKEALAAVRIIKESLGTTIFDSKIGRKRPLTPGDIVILMRGVKNYGDVFYRILTENDIAAYIDDNDGFFDTIEINTFLSLLSLLDNPKQDIPLLTVMRSEILGFSIEEMVKIRLRQKNGSYYNALVRCSLGENAEKNMVKNTEQNGICEEDEADALTYEMNEVDALSLKCRNALKKIERWRQMAAVLPLEELVWELLLESGFYVAMGAMPAGAQRQANLRALVDKALQYRNFQSGSLYGFISYIEAVKAGKISMGQVKMVGENEDTVRIMTIHKSKGLEFPMVLVCGYCRKLNYTPAGKNLAIHKDLGIGLPVVNYRESWYRTTIVQNVIKARFHQEEVEEEKRILYVAMTRAKDILYLLGITDGNKRDEEGGEFFQNRMDQLREESAGDYSYYTMSGKIICEKPQQMQFISDQDIAGLSKGKKRSAEAALWYIDEAAGAAGSNETVGASGETLKDGANPHHENAEKNFADEVLRRMEFSYPYKDALETKSKYSVSELNRQQAERNTSAQTENLRPELRKPKSLREERTFSAAEVGTFTHAVLEHMDFRRAEQEGITYVRELLQDMVSNEILTTEEAETVNGQRMVDFVESDLGKRLAVCTKVYREKPFNVVKEINGNCTLVQGIIDCWFDEGDGLVLLDYKTTHISPSRFEQSKREIADRYRMQMELYQEALEEATGKTVKESYLFLTNIGKVIPMNEEKRL